MQIHEITQSAPKSMNEGVMGTLASVGSGLAAAGKAFGGAMAQKFAQTQGQNLNSPQPAVAGGLERQRAAGQMSKTAIPPLAKKLRIGWSQTLQGLIKKATNPAAPQVPATSPSDLRDDELTKALYSFLNTIVGEDITANLVKIDDPDKTAAELVQELNSTVEAAIRAAKNPRQDQSAIWNKMAECIVRYQNIKAAARTSQAGRAAEVSYTQNGKPMFNGQRYNKNDPSHIMAVQAFGGNPATYNPQY